MNINSNGLGNDIVSYSNSQSLSESSKMRRYKIEDKRIMIIDCKIKYY